MIFAWLKIIFTHYYLTMFIFVHSVVVEDIAEMSHSLLTHTIETRHHCIVVNRVNIMLSTALRHAFLSEQRTFSVSIFEACRCVSCIFELSSMFLITVSIQVVFGRPTGLGAGLMNSCRAFCAGTSAGRRSRCPNHVNLLLMTMILQGWYAVLSYNRWFDIILGHLMWMIDFTEQSALKGIDFVFQCLR